MKILLTHAKLLEYGGAERVLEAVAAIFPDADIATLAATADAIPASLVGRRIITSFLNRMPARRRLFRHLSFLAPLAVESIDASPYDLVISCDGTFTKGVLTADHAVHVCYCHSPHRSLWDRHSEYLRSFSGISRFVFSLSSHYLRIWDLSAAHRIDLFIANSEHIRKRIRKYYGRDSVVVYPPVNIEGVTAIGRVPGDYYLSVGRLDPVKKTELLIEACKQLRRKLIVVGTGSQERHLRHIADHNIEFRGWVPDDNLGRLYHGCRALLFASYEDLGIVPIEAQAHGAPVIAYGAGGGLESIEPGVGGLHFTSQSVGGVVEAIKQFEAIEHHFVPEKIRASVMRFSVSAFNKNMSRVIEEAVTPKWATVRYPQKPRATEGILELDSSEAVEHTAARFVVAEPTHRTDEAGARKHE